MSRKQQQKEVKKFTRGQIVALYAIIRDLKASELNKEAFVKYMMLRVELKAVFDEFEKAREEFSAQTKPEGWQEGDCTKEWEKMYQPLAAGYLKKETDIDTRIFTIDECIALIRSNPEVSGSVGDVIVEMMKK